MAFEYVGNIIPSPGFYKGNSLSDPELLYSTARFTQKGVTLAAGQGIVEIGQIMAQRTSDKKWVKAGASGAGEPSGVLRRSVDTGSDANGPTFQGNVVISGILKLGLVKGDEVPANVTALGARVDDVMGTFIF